MENTPQISIITINYGGSDKVAQLWDSIQAHIGALSYEFIVVDNHSPNQDAKNLKAAFANTPVHLVCLNQNLGFGGGYSEGLKFARGEFVAIINPDIQLQPQCLEQLISALNQEPNAGLVAPKLVNPDGTLQQNARHFPTPWVMFGRRLATRFQWAYDCEEQWYNSKNAQAVDWVQGSFMCLRRETLLQNLDGGFDTRFFLFLEDTDLCRRLWQQNLRVLLIPTAIATHGPNRLSGGSLWQAWRKKTFWIHISSACKYFWKYKGQSLPNVN